MKIYTILILCVVASFNGFSQNILSSGKQPQMTVDSKGILRVIYGENDKIYFLTSADQGKTFTSPVLVGEVKAMHLGMTRGPQLATSRDFSMVSAMDKKGNIHAFKLEHKTGKWQPIRNINDLDGSAPEGLMSLAADGNNNFYAVWLDLRQGRQNNLFFSTLKGNSDWGKNKMIYQSPDGHVCECCKPSIAVKGSHLSVMFRNWLKGSRDCYLITSNNSGKTFTPAQKLGEGTWVLNACPMDGGGLTIDSNNKVHTAWRREADIYYAEPGQKEEKIAGGKSVGINGNVIYWQKGNDLMIKPIIGKEQKIGEGTALQIVQTEDQSIYAIWEKDNQIVFRKE